VSSSIYWHDYETFGADPRRDRPSQFAGVRTDEALNVIGQPLQLYCQPAPDFLPHPYSCLLTGITPDKALAEGVPEAEFTRRILAEFAQPQTCGAGYNSLRFDDEMTRQLLYRNFHDPYEREWKNGNSRWDIIDMTRLCCALRPEGIVWPRREDGAPSFRLEELTAANGIGHENAHDALSDVLATIALAKLIRDRQPRLYDYVYQLRDKTQVLAQLDVLSKKPVLHVSSMYSAAHGALALVAPLTRHPTDKNGIIVYDLRQDPAQWMHLSVEAIQRRLFTRQDALEEGELRIPLKVLHVNRCPVVAPASLLDGPTADRFGIDLAKARDYWQMLVDNPEAIMKVASAFDRAHAQQDGPAEDPDFMIYSGGFFGADDKRAMAQIHTAHPEELALWRQPFRDARLSEMLFRFRARNYPDRLTPDERQRWQLHCQDALLRAPEHPGAGVSWTEFTAELHRLRQGTADAAELRLLDDIADYGQRLLTPESLQRVAR
jgi:exodeoxyribonuclease-1